jgi:hypothetical protein
MDVKKREFRRSIIIYQSILVVVAVIGAASSLINISNKIPFLVTVSGVVLITGVVVAYQMWKSYDNALQEAAQRERVSLGKARAEVGLSASIQQMLQKTEIAEIDIGGLALRSNLFRKGGRFSEELLALLRKNRQVKVRVWLLDPRSNARRMREIAERQKEDGLLQQAGLESLEMLRDIVLTIVKEQKTRRPEIVLVDRVAITHFILRVDNVMFVTNYLQHNTGNASPTVQLKNGDDWFDEFKKQFELCFKLHSANLYPSQEEMRRVLQS